MQSNTRLFAENTWLHTYDRSKNDKKDLGIRSLSKNPLCVVSISIVSSKTSATKRFSQKFRSICDGFLYILILTRFTVPFTIIKQNYYYSASFWFIYISQYIYYERHDSIWKILFLWSSKNKHPVLYIYIYIYTWMMVDLHILLTRAEIWWPHTHLG